jgi:hypothetical protein
MRQLMAATIVVLCVTAFPAAAGAQQTGAPGDTAETVVTPPPAPPWEAARAPADTSLRGPVLPGQVRPAAERALADEAPAPAAPDNVVIPITTLTIVLAVILLIVLID